MSRLASGDIDRAVVAYFIQASASNAGQVPRLLRALCDISAPHAPFALHIDASLNVTATARTFEAARDALCKAGCASTALVAVPSEYVTYRGITLALNYLTGATALLRHRAHFDFFINLSAADYPTARPALIAQLLAAARKPRLSFIEWKAPVKWKRFSRGRLGRIFVDSALVSGARGTYELPPDEERGYPAAPPEWRNPLYPHIGFEVAKSSGWFVWHRQLVEYLLVDAVPRKLVGTFSLSDASDEHIFATAVWNSAYFRKRAVPSNLRNIFFEAPNGSTALADDGITRSRQHPYYVDDVDEQGNLLFWDALWNSPAFFTRKVRPQGIITDLIDRHVLGIGEGADHIRRANYEQRLKKTFYTLVNTHIKEHPDISSAPPFKSLFLSVKYD